MFKKSITVQATGWFDHIKAASGNSSIMGSGTDDPKDC
jgi:hypothetical protein